jgi:alcohol dehydrogenase (NADP+)
MGGCVCRHEALEHQSTRDGLLTTSKTASRIKENFDVSALPEGAMREINEGIKQRARLNPVVETGVPGFILRGK